MEKNKKVENTPRKSNQPYPRMSPNRKNAGRRKM
jgi:hypothetical protein